MAQTQQQKKTDDNAAAGFGCLVLFGLACALIWAAWDSAFGCLLADNLNYVTSQCALKHLQKPSCNDDRDILQVDEVTDVSTTNPQGQRDEVRTVIYRFRKRPTSGPVSDTVMRDTASMVKMKSGEWMASCENLAPTPNH